MKKDLRFFCKLFTSTFTLSAFTFGGGYVIIPMMRRKFVEQYHWMEEDEVLDMTAIAQSSPGPVAVNAAILMGYRLAGGLGALVAAVGTVLPPLLIIAVISVGYEAFRDNVYVSRVLRGMQAGVAAVVFSVVLRMTWALLKDKKWASLALMAAALAASVWLETERHLDPAVLRGGGRSFHPLDARAGREAGMTALLQLFWSFFQVGLFSFGGGYAAMPLIQAQVVDLHGWLNMTEFADIITISQMTPGPIAINSATFVGMRIAGVAGALVATVGCVLPSCIVSLLLAKLYLKYRSLDLIHGALGGLRPAVIALIASAGVTILLGALQTSAGGMDWLNAGVFAAGLLILLLRPKTDPILVMVGAGLVGLVGYSWLPL